jgi:hypothetical protein
MEGEMSEKKKPWSVTVAVTGTVRMRRVYARSEEEARAKVRTYLADGDVEGDELTLEPASDPVVEPIVEVGDMALVRGACRVSPERRAKMPGLSVDQILATDHAYGVCDSPQCPHHSEPSR